MGEHLARLHEHLLTTEKHVDLLLKLAYGFKIKLEEKVNVKMAKLQFKADKNNRSLLGKQVDQHLLSNT
jgi:hypothetical protein